MTSERRSIILPILLVFCGLLLSPLLLLCSPFVSFYVVARLLFNIGRATHFRPVASLCLTTIVLQEIGCVATCYVPMLLKVLWGYVACAEKDTLRCHIPYILTPSEAARRRKELPLPPSSSSSESSSSLPLPRPVTPPTPLPLQQVASCGRCLLDVAAVHDAKLRPVVVFLYGGAWGSGSRWYYSSFATQLRQAANACVVVPDYPTYPHGNILDMIECLEAVLQWVDKHIALYGGDRRDVTLVGHSAGGHLCALWALRRSLSIAFDRNPNVLPQSLLKRGSHTAPVSLLRMFGGVRNKDPFADNDNNLHKKSEQGRGVRAVRRPDEACVSFTAVEPPNAPRKQSPPSSFSSLNGAAGAATTTTITSTVVGSPKSPPPPSYSAANPPRDRIRVRQVLLFSSPLNLVTHFDWEAQRCVEEVSPMRGATAGFWEASSPTLVLRALRHELEGELRQRQEEVAATDDNEAANGDASGEIPLARQYAMVLDTLPILRLYHDHNDKTVSFHQSTEFRDELIALAMTIAACDTVKDGGRMKRSGGAAGGSESVQAAAAAAAGGRPEGETVFGLPSSVAAAEKAKEAMEEKCPPVSLFPFGHSEYVVEAMRRVTTSQQRRPSVWYEAITEALQQEQRN